MYLLKLLMIFCYLAKEWTHSKFYLDFREGEWGVIYLRRFADSMFLKWIKNQWLDFSLHDHSTALIGKLREHEGSTSRHNTQQMLGSIFLSSPTFVESFAGIPFSIGKKHLLAISPSTEKSVRLIL